MSDMVPEWKAPAVEIVIRADSMPNPKSSPFLAVTKRAAKTYPWLALKAVVRLCAATMRNGGGSRIPAITLHVAPDIDQTVDLDMGGNIAGSDVSSVFTTDPFAEPTRSAKDAEGKQPQHSPERPQATPASCKHCRYLACQRPIVVRRFFSSHCVRSYSDWYRIPSPRVWTANWQERTAQSKAES